MTPNDDEERSGKAVDSTGGPVVDPTANVIALIESANARQDDLRIEVTKRTDAAIVHQEVLANVRERCAKEVAGLREQHAKELRQLDYDRQDNVRKVDVLNAATAAERALVAIQTLATAQAAERDTLRALVASTAAAVATQTNQQIQSVATLVSASTERIAALEKSSYEGMGKQKLADPMMTELVAEMKRMATLQAIGGGKSEGIKDVWGWIAAAFGIGAAIAVWIK